MSKRQVFIALSTTKVEYMVATHGSKEAVWLQRLCSGIGFEQRAMKIGCDNQRVIFQAKNPAYHSKNNHIDVQYHFVREMVERNKVLLEKVDMLENIKDSLTMSMSVV
jgi:limonene-1,2-epoxide hydrolase